MRFCSGTQSCPLAALGHSLTQLCPLQVPARFAYGILLANVLMYALGLLLGLLKGSKAAEHFFLTFCQINERINEGEFYRRAPR